MVAVLHDVDAVTVQPLRVSYHSAETVAGRLEEARFNRVDETAQWPTNPGGHVMVRGGAVMAWFVPENVTGGLQNHWLAYGFTWLYG